ncbi:MAG: hypothetical protein LBE91_01590 [Tannerella sp.]|jgi:hypothetical protein|nr:hypothetical protein [Tannerella sp.]
MVLISTKEFRAQQKKYFDLAVDEQVVVKRGKRFFSITASSKPDNRLIDYEWVKEYMAIPEKYRCDPFEMSPSGDLFYADKRNVEKVKQAIAEAEQEIKEGKFTRINGLAELERFMESL